VVILLRQLSDKNIATVVEMGFSVQQATAALQQSGGNLDVALNSLLPSDVQNKSADGPPAVGGRESRAVASNATSNGPVAHRTDRTDTRARQPPPDSGRNDRTGIVMCSSTTCKCACPWHVI